MLMKKKLLVLLFSLATLALASCGGGNDVASSGANAVRAAATDSSPASAPSIPTAEPKVNGQIDGRTGVATVVAQMTIGANGASGGPCPGIPVNACSSITSQSQCPNYYVNDTQCAWGSYCSNSGGNCGPPWTVYSNGGCAQSASFGNSGPLLSPAQLNACVAALNAWVRTDPISACTALGGVISGGDTCLPP